MFPGNWVRHEAPPGAEGLLPLQVLCAAPSQARQARQAGKSRHSVFGPPAAPPLLPLPMSSLPSSLRVKHQRQRLLHAQKPDKEKILDTAPSAAPQIQAVTDSESHCLCIWLQSTLLCESPSQSLEPKYVGEPREVKRSTRHFAYAFPTFVPATWVLGLGTWGRCLSAIQVDRFVLVNLLYPNLLLLQRARPLSWVSLIETGLMSNTHQSCRIHLTSDLLCLFASFASVQAETQQPPVAGPASCKPA